MCSHLFGSSSGGILGAVGDVIGGVAGGYFGGPVGAAAGAEVGGTVGGVAGGEKFGQAAGNALIGAGIAGVGDYAAEAFGGATAAGGSDLFGVSGTPAAPSAVSAGGFGGVPDGSQVIVGDNSTTADDPNADPNIDPTTGMPIPPPPPAGGAASAAAALSPVGGPTTPGSYNPAMGAPPAPPGMLGATDPTTGQTITTGIGPNGQITSMPDQPGMLSKIANSLGIQNSNLLGAGVAGIGLAKDLIAPQQLQGQPQLSAEAATMAQQSAVMQNYLSTGTLPPGVQTAINSATQGAQAAIRAKYASQGLSGSSMEQQELSQAKLNAVSSGAQVAIQLYNSGLTEANISQQIYNELMTTDQKQQAATSSAIANVAAALSGGTRAQQPQQPVAAG